MDPLIEVTGLRYTYPDGLTATNGIDFVLYPNETVVLLGPNGSGKTTFLLQLAGILHGTGSIHIEGTELTKNTAKQVRRKVGIVFQDADAQLFMPTVLDDVAYAPRSSGATEEEADRLALQCLQSVSLTHAAGRAPYQLSAGEKRRAAIAGVLAMEPKIILFDEPTTSLDPPGQRELTNLIRKLGQGKLIATHDVAWAKAIADRAVFFESGRIVSSGSVSELAAQHDW